MLIYILIFLCQPDVMYHSKLCIETILLKSGTRYVYFTIYTQQNKSLSCLSIICDTLCVFFTIYTKDKKQDKTRQDKIYFESARHITINIKLQRVLNRL